VTIEVEDNGPGIPGEMKDKILQPVFTTKKGTQGACLGLSIIYDIIKAHGGNIEIVSVSNEHTSIKLTIRGK
jgi:signal transduction histidine kinase